MSELGDALRRHSTPGGEDAPAHVLRAAVDVGGPAPARRERPTWTRGPAVILAALVLAIPAGYAIAQRVQDDGADTAMIEIKQAEAEKSAIDAMWIDAAQRAEAGELRASVDQDRAAATLRSAVDLPSDPAARNELEDEMIALTEKLRVSGDLPQIGGGFERTWGLIPPSIISAMVNGEPVIIDRSKCASVVAAFSRAGVELPTAYGSACGDDS